MDNRERKKILESIDKKELVLNKVLLQSGLTTYMKDDNILFNDLSEFISYSRNFSRPITHLKEIEEKYFMPSQVEVLNQLHSFSKILFAARTSFGKTLLLKEYIYVNNIKNVAIILPTNALAKEVLDSIYDNKLFQEKYNIFDSIKQDGNINNEEMNIFVGTQEKFSEISYMFDEIDLLLIDEAYKLEDKPTDGTRSYVLSKILLESIEERAKQIILLSPLAKFEGFEEFGFKIIETEFNPVDKIIEDKMSEIKFNDKIASSLIGNEPTIYFCSKPSDLLQFHQRLKNLKGVNLSSELSAEILNFIGLINQEIHPEWAVSKLLRMGILSNHGQMPKFIQKRMISLFKNADNNYNFLIGNNSISEGINTPTKNLFIDENIDLNPKYLMRLNNTIGRAGRLNVNPIGYIYSKLDISEKLDLANVKLALVDENEFDEASSEKNTESIEILSEEINVTHENIILILQKYNISLSRLRKMINLFSKWEDSFYIEKGNENPAKTQMIFLTNTIYPDWSRNESQKEIDKYCLTVTLSSAFKESEESDYIPINNYYDKIRAFKHYFRKYAKQQSVPTDSVIIDSLIWFRYSALEYKVMPIINVFFDLKEIEGVKLKPTKSIETLFAKIRLDYNKIIMSRPFFEKLSTNQKKLLRRLIDEGINVSNENFNDDMLFELEAALPDKYSISSIERKMRNLSLKSQYKDKYSKILNLYF